MILSTEIYLIRHGESEGNKLAVVLGHSNLGLTELGKKQADLTAKHLKDQGLSPAAIYSSDLARAHSTAESAASLFGMNITADVGLRELYAGAWEMKSYTEISETFSESYNAWMKNIGRAKCDDGESVAELQDRMVTVISRIACKHDGEVIFIFTHATAIRTFAAYCMGKTLDEIKDVPWPTNSSVTRVRYSNKKFSLIEYSRDDFMGGLITKFSNNI